MGDRWNFVGSITIYEGTLGLRVSCLVGIGFKFLFGMGGSVSLKKIVWRITER